MLSSEADIGWAAVPVRYGILTGQ